LQRKCRKDKIFEQTNFDDLIDDFEKITFSRPIGTYQDIDGSFRTAIQDNTPDTIQMLDKGETQYIGYFDTRQMHREYPNK